MSPPDAGIVRETDAWSDAALAAALFAVDPAGLGGVVLRACPGPVRATWLARLRELLPARSPIRRVPLHVSEGRLSGGLDLTATLRLGRPVEQRGILAEADGGIVVLAMAERLPPGVAACVGHALDAREVVLERDGLTRRHPTRFGVVALDEGLSEEEGPPAALLDRLAFHLDLGGILPSAAEDPDFDPESLASERAETIAEARERLPLVVASDGIVEAICASAMALGVDSLRASHWTLRAARTAAALDARAEVEEQDVTLAARLVLLPRATAWPTDERSTEPAPRDEPAQEPASGPESANGSPPEPSPPSDPRPGDAREAEDGPDPQDPEQGEGNDREPVAAEGVGGEGPDQEAPPEDDGALAERVLEAVQIAMPGDLLATLRTAEPARARSGALGRSGARRASRRRGRRIGVQRGDPVGGARLDVIETLRAAAPWQPLRRAEAVEAEVGNGNGNATGPASDSAAPGSPRLKIRREDFRIGRFRERSETTTVFVVDASGSAAVHRLAEAKGAVELLLAESYVRRDRVALIAFRGRQADLLLPPTRSLARAKRSLAALPGGGGTPLAAGIEASMDVAESVRCAGGTPIVVFLSDGQANVARDGMGGRKQAGEDARAAARRLRAAGVGVLWIDTAVRPQADARELAREMQATYLPLPRADSVALYEAARGASSRLLATGAGA